MQKSIKRNCDMHCLEFIANFQDIFAKIAYNFIQLGINIALKNILAKFLEKPDWKYTVTGNE